MAFNSQQIMDKQKRTGSGVKTTVGMVQWNPLGIPDTAGAAARVLAAAGGKAGAAGLNGKSE
jgi:hypothetical protein